jgi:glycosyltransferase involved in cell wall biosynthesis
MKMSHDAFRPSVESFPPAGQRGIAVLVPCRNEAATIGQVIADFQRHLPEAKIYVYDNASTDMTADIARAGGANVRVEPMVGKGHVVRRMFADVEADIYVMVDGDGTYDASAAPQLVEEMLTYDLDMVNCARIPVEDSVYRTGHRMGNRLLTGLVAQVFGNQLSDMLSGYRALSRRFVKSFPALSTGFEIETEITVHALELRVPISEISAPYFKRRRQNLARYRPLGERRATASILLCDLRHAYPDSPGAWDSGCNSVLEDRVGRPTSDGRSCYGSHNPCFSQPLLRIDH